MVHLILDMLYVTVNYRHFNAHYVKEADHEN